MTGTEKSGLGILDNTGCALFSDFGNHGLQDAVVVRANELKQYPDHAQAKSLLAQLLQ